jgi:hypothetical protein
MAQLVTAKVPAKMHGVVASGTTVNAAQGQAGAAPTQAQFNALVDLVNDLRQLLINAGMAK